MEVSTIYISAELTQEGSLYWTGKVKGSAVIPSMNVNALVDIIFDVMTNGDGIQHVIASKH